MQSAVLQTHLLLPAPCGRRPVVVVCGLSARSARRRQTKQWRQQKKAEKAWHSSTQKEELWYQVTVPPPDLLLDSTPQFYEQPPQFYDEQQQQQQMGLPPLLQANWGVHFQGVELPGLQPGAHRAHDDGPAAPAGAVWVEHRRSAAEQQQYRQRQRTARRSSSQHQKHTLEELLESNEQVERLKMQGYPGSGSGGAPRRGRQQSNVQKQQQKRLNSE